MLLSVTRASILTALKNGLPAVGLKSVCIPNPLFLTPNRMEESSLAGNVEPSKVEIDVAEVVESGSSVMKLISPSDNPSSELFICNSDRANIFLSAVSASY